MRLEVGGVADHAVDHMLGRKMLAAGFSPTPDQVAAGDLKDVFMRWQQAEAIGAAAE
jgi:hypothetical protein